MFVTPDNKAGFAIKSDGDIVSAFKHEKLEAYKAGDSMLALAVQQGGVKLDAFDTVLPKIYGDNGFRAVARLAWDDKQKPENWDYKTFKKYNDGRPDVVFMVYDPEHAKAYKSRDGKRVETYEEGVAAQAHELAAQEHTGHPGKSYSKNAWVDANGTIHTSNVYDAQRALFEDRKVELKQLKQVSTLIQRLGETAAEMAKHGEEAPVFNLCNVSVEGTNLFCSDQKGIPRAEMPVIPAKRTKDFVKYLKSLGYETEKSTERADHLRATQNEISGAKVAVSMARIDKEGFYKRLVVSRDDYILDGHHTWAAQLGVDARDGTLKGDKHIKITRVDIPIIKLIEEADKWTKEQGIAKKPASQMKDWMEGVTMAIKPGKDESQADWMSRCVPDMTGQDGGTKRPQEQAVAACMQMWRDKDKTPEGLDPPEEDETVKISWSAARTKWATNSRIDAN